MCWQLDAFLALLTSRLPNTETECAIDPTLFQTTLETLAEPLLVLDAAGRVVLVNQALHRLLGRSVRRAPRLEFVHPLAYGALGGLLGKTAVAGVQAVLEGTSPHYGVTYEYGHGAERCVLKLLVTRLGPTGGAALVFTDLTEQRRREADIYIRANLDPLTGLPNRRLFFTEANRVLALAERHGHPFALVYMDLNGFKTINDRGGHEVGDAALCGVADRLKGLLRGGDLLARLGGDEFLLLLPETGEHDSLAAVARYAGGLEEPFWVGGEPLILSGSFGVAHYPRHAQTVGELVALADRAMYGAKTRGGGVNLYSAAPEAVASDRYTYDD